MGRDDEFDFTRSTARHVRLLLNPTSRISALIVLSYVTAGIGVWFGFAGGFDHPMTAGAGIGIAMLAVSFFLLFYVSVTVVSFRGG